MTSRWAQFNPWNGTVAGGPYTGDDGPWKTWTGALDVKADQVPVHPAALSPRISFTYDLTGDGKNVIKASYSLYQGILNNLNNESAPPAPRGLSTRPSSITTTTIGPTKGSSSATPWARSTRSGRRRRRPPGTGIIMPARSRPRVPRRRKSRPTSTTPTGKPPRSRNTSSGSKSSSGRTSRSASTATTRSNPAA